MKRERKKEREKREGRREARREGGKEGERERRREGGRVGGWEASQHPGRTVYSTIKKQGFSNMNAHTSPGISTADSVSS